MGQLAEKIHAKYPGAYSDLDDDVLEAQILAKHPEYQDLATEAGPFINKETATSEQFAPKPDPFSVKNFITGGDSGPSVKGALENTARSLQTMRQGVKSAILSPIQTFKAIDRITPESVGEGIKHRVGQYVNDPAETIYQDPLAFGMDAAMVGGAANAGIRGTLHAATSRPAQITGAALKGGTKGFFNNIPLATPAVKGAWNAGAARAAELKQLRSGRLSMIKVPPVVPQATAGLPAADVADALAQLRAPTRPMSAGMVKSPTGVAERNAVSPQQSIPGMTATLPDKWGASAIQEAGTDLRSGTRPAMTPPTPMSPQELVKAKILMQQGMSKADAASAIIKARNYAGQ